MLLHFQVHISTNHREERDREYQKLNSSKNNLRSPRPSKDDKTEVGSPTEENESKEKEVVEGDPGEIEEGEEYLSGEVTIKKMTFPSDEETAAPTAAGE